MFVKGEEPLAVSIPSLSSLLFISKLIQEQCGPSKVWYNEIVCTVWIQNVDRLYTRGVKILFIGNFLAIKEHICHLFKTSLKPKHLNLCIETLILKRI